MRALVVVTVQPFIQIGLKRVDAVIELLAERDLVELLQDGLVEAFANAIGLRRLHLGRGVVNIVDCQEKLEVVLIDTATIFRAAICQNTQHRQVVFFMKRQHPIVEQISGRYRGFGGVELGVGDLGISVDIGLLIDPANALLCAD